MKLKQITSLPAFPYIATAIVTASLMILVNIFINRPTDSQVTALQPPTTISYAAVSPSVDTPSNLAIGVPAISDMTMLVEVGDPVQPDNEPLFQFAAPKSDTSGSLSAINDYIVENGHLVLSNTFDPHFTGRSQMTEGDYLSVVVRYTFANDAVISWTDEVSNNPHFKWAEHPESIDVVAGGNAVVTYRYEPSTAEWTASIKVLT